MGKNSHIFCHEASAASALFSVGMCPIPNTADGTLPLSEIKQMIRDDSDVHCCRTAAVCIENTQNVCGGRVLPLAYVDELGDFCKSRGLKLHMDGARLFNASTALGVPVSRVVEKANTVSFCLSKGLGAPVGSILAGS